MNNLSNSLFNIFIIHQSIKLHEYMYHPSDQLLNTHDPTPSSTTNSSVVKTICSYKSFAESRACLCHGPEPPRFASSLLRHIPIKKKKKRKAITNQHISRLSYYQLFFFFFSNKHTSRQILPVNILYAKPIFQQPATNISLSMRMRI